MSNNKLESVQFLFDESPTLSTADPFQHGGVPEKVFGGMLSYLDNVAEPYIEAGNEHLSEETIVAIKGLAANRLKIEFGVKTMDQFQVGATEMNEIAHRSDGTELENFVLAFRTNYLNFLKDQVSKTSEITMDQLDIIIQRPLKLRQKSWLRRKLGV